LIAIIPAIALPEASMAGDLVSQGKPVTSNVAYYDKRMAWLPGNQSFPPTNIVDGNFGDNERTGGWSYWLADDSIIGAEVTIDLGRTYKIDKIALQDTHNRGWRDRGTRDFLITAATAADGPFWPIASGAFSHHEWAKLSIKTIPIDDGIRNIARYVRVRALTGWGGRGVGLNEVQVFGVPAIETVPVPGCKITVAQPIP
jgi:hypothetical protein